jgi:predicted ATP-dependent serine protease
MSEKSITEQADVLGKLFERTISTKFGTKRSPEPLIMSTGITHLDALLGGGLISSGPVMISSTPESGKSTFAYQMSSMFHNTFENGIIVYIDIEGSGSSQTSTDYKMSRIDTFGLANTHRFRYEPIVLNIKEFFDLIGQLVEQKLIVEKKTGKEFYVLIIWDSVAATRSSKTDLAEDHNKIIG